jgi:NAD(P)-dependent dehydrogenase (short-subunit alcohol dehydrogenase family)
MAGSTPSSTPPAFSGGAVHETDDATWDQMMNVNLRAAFHFRAVVPHMRKAGRGRIVAIGSRAPLIWAPGIAAYAASKAAMVSSSGVSRWKIRTWDYRQRDPP